MPYVIQNKRSGTYIQTQTGNKLSCLWRANVEDATEFKTAGAAQNFILHNYTGFAKKNPAAPPVKELEIIPLMTQEEKTEQELLPMRSMVDYLDTVVRAEEIRRQLTELYDVYSTMLSYADLERNDILHKIELEEKISAPDRMVLFKRLREVLVHRRKCKDMCAYLQQYETSGFLEACAKLEEMNRDFAHNLEARTYKPRVLTELFEKGVGQSA